MIEVTYGIVKFFKGRESTLEEVNSLLIKNGFEPLAFGSNPLNRSKHNTNYRFAEKPRLGFQFPWKIKLLKVYLYFMPDIEPGSIPNKEQHEITVDIEGLQVTNSKGEPINRLV